MTYQQLFDDLIGEAPLSTVDVDRVIGQQRRARRLRIGVGTSAVAAAVALVVFGTTGLIGKPHAAPAPVTNRSPAVTTVPGTNQDLDRIDAAVVAALTRAEPRLVWSAKGVPASTTPNWESTARSMLPDETLDSGYSGAGDVRIGTVEVGVMVRIERDGAAAWKRFADLPCATAKGMECGERTGPGGEKIKVRRAVRENDVPARLRDRIPSRTESQDVLALRRDGSLVETTAMTTGEDSRLPFTAEQLIAVALDPAVVLAPASAATPSSAAPATPNSTVTTVAGTEADAARLDAALTAALRRQASGFTWLTRWAGPISPTPVWFQPTARLSINSPYRDHASFRVGDRGGQVSLQMRREGRAYWEHAPPCPTAGLAGRNCTVSDGPGGEKIRARRLLGDFGRRGDLHRPTLGSVRHVEVLRADGTLVELSLTGAETVLSLGQLIDVARDPAIALAPPPAGFGGNRQAFGEGPGPDYMPVGETAASAALDDVSPDGTIFLRISQGGGGGPSGPSVWSFSFLVQRAGLAGDGEILVQRRMGITVSCENVRALPPAMHPRHTHSGECTESTRPDGNRVVSVVARSSGTVTYDVFVQRPDRNTVEVVLDNRPNTGSTTDMPEMGGLQSIWPKGAEGGASPPLTLEQVTELAGHPDLVNLLP